MQYENVAPMEYFVRCASVSRCGSISITNQTSSLAFFYPSPAPYTRPQHGSVSNIISFLTNSFSAWIFFFFIQMLNLPSFFLCDCSFFQACPPVWDWYGGVQETDWTDPAASSGCHHMSKECTSLLGHLRGIRQVRLSIIGDRPNTGAITRFIFC